MLKKSAHKNIQCAYRKTLQLAIKPADALPLTDNPFGPRIKLELSCSMEEIDIA